MPVPLAQKQDQYGDKLIHKIFRTDAGAGLRRKDTFNGAAQRCSGSFNPFFNIQQAADNRADNNSQGNRRQVMQFIDKEYAHTD
ncbi:Uncharacterised protein [Klebsiella pneumoniae]|nr:Uncharacterised protein [Klebsiella pneumoniae]